MVCLMPMLNGGPKAVMFTCQKSVAFFFVGRPFVRIMVGRPSLVSISLCRNLKTHKAQLKSLFFPPYFGVIIWILGSIH